MIEAAAQLVEYGETVGVDVAPFVFQHLGQIGRRHHPHIGRDEYALQKTRHQRRMRRIQQPPCGVAGAQGVESDVVEIHGGRHSLASRRTFVIGGCFAGTVQLRHSGLRLYSCGADCTPIPLRRANHRGKRSCASSMPITMSCITTDSEPSAAQTHFSLEIRAPFRLISYWKRLAFDTPPVMGYNFALKRDERSSSSRFFMCYLRC